MGSAVSKVAGVVSKVPVIGKPAGSLINKAGQIVGEGLGAAAGQQANTPTGYNPNAAAFQHSKDQLAFQQQLRAQALGQDPTSVAQQQLKTGTDRNLAQIAGSVAGQRNNQALAMRQGLRAQAGVNQDMAAQAANLRAQEMASAQDAYTQDLVRQQQSLQNLEGMKSGIAGATQALQAQRNADNAASKQGFIGNVMNAGATIFSDEKLKKDVKEVDSKSIEEFLSNLKAKAFKYKSPNGESYQNGTVTGIMAQDLEKSKIGKDMVSDSDEGKQVDMKKAVPATLAAVADIMKRIKKLEGKGN